MTCALESSLFLVFAQGDGAQQGSGQGTRGAGARRVLWGSFPIYRVTGGLEPRSVTAELVPQLGVDGVECLVLKQTQFLVGHAQRMRREFLGDAHLPGTSLYQLLVPATSSH